MSGGIQVTRPQSRREFMTKLEVPGFTNPNEVFSEPQKLGQPEFNRALEYTRKNDKDKVFSVGIKDIDEAVLYYFNEVLKLQVNQNNTKISVPVIYGTPENWKSVQEDGYYRDQKGKLMAPLIMFKRSTITQNRNLGNKVDGNKAHNLQLFEKKYSSRNSYSNFAALTSRVPEREYLLSIIPDYVTVEYTCVIFTYFVEQMDSIIESLNFASRSYWGDPNKFLFYSSIENFQDNLTFDTGEDRVVKSTFNLTLNGYLIPDTEMTKVAAAAKSYGLSKVTFGIEVTDSVEASMAKTNPNKGKALNSVTIGDSMNVVYNVTSGVDQNTISYLLTNKQLIATNATSNTATFTGSWKVAPTGLPPTGLSNFTFFVNGNFVESNAVINFEDLGGGTCLLTVNTGVLGYELESTDVILAIGKFN
jgi:hypothetical protein